MAPAFAEGLSRVLRLLSAPGSVSDELVEGLTVAEYLSRSTQPSSAGMVDAA